MRFLADADFNNAIVWGCRRREPAIDFLSANDANLAGVPDPGVLAIAAEQERILISHDFRTNLTRLPDYAPPFCRLPPGSWFEPRPDPGTPTLIHR